MRFSSILKPTNISTEKWPFEGEKGKKKKESSVRQDDYYLVFCDDNDDYLQQK